MPRHQTPWHQDPAVLERIAMVERLHFAGKNNSEIARQVGVAEGTIRSDLKRAAGRWLQKIEAQAEALRAEKVAELEDLKRRAIEAAEWDHFCEKAVLFGGALEDEDLGELRVYRDDKGSAQFRGNKQGALNVARQCVMDQAKVLGLIVEKQEHTTPVPVRIYEVDTSDGRSR